MNGKLKRRPSFVKKDSPHKKLYIESFSALQDFLHHRPQAVKAVYCRDKLAPKVEKLLGTRSHLRQSLETLPEEDRIGHAALYAEIDLNPLGENELLERLKGRGQDLLLALDHVEDPRNLGAIARSAAFFGVNEILVPKDRQVLFTKASVATSQGAFALSDLVVVTNLGRSLEKLKKAGYWIIGADLQGESLEEVVGVYDKVVLVLGAEGKGMSAGIKTKCDRLLTIVGAERRLDSLNVSVAAGIMLRGLFLGKKQFN